MPTAVTLAAFSAAPQQAAILVTWETASELDTLGYNLYRSLSATGPWTRLNTTLIPSQYPGQVTGGIYKWRDQTVAPGNTYYYLLEVLDIHDGSLEHGPISVTLQSEPKYRLYLPFVLRP